MLRNNVLIRIKKIFWRMGFDIRRSQHALPADYSSQVCQDPIGLSYKSGNRGMLIKVPLAKCVHFDWGAFNSLDGSQSPYISTLKDYKNKVCLNYSGSNLESFYNNFQPLNMLEYMRLDHAQNMALAEIGPFGAIYPWLDENPVSKEKYIKSVLTKGHVINGERFYLEDGDQFFGPVSFKKGCSEFNRLVTVYESIKNKGYLSRADSPIIGTIIMDKIDGDWSVLIRGGNHRIAALAVLGYSYVNVLIESEGRGGIVLLSEIDSWPAVKNNILTRKEALFFSRRFLNA